LNRDPRFCNDTKGTLNPSSELSCDEVLPITVQVQLFNDASYVQGDPTDVNVFIEILHSIRYRTIVLPLEPKRYSLTFTDQDLQLHHT